MVDVLVAVRCHAERHGWIEPRLALWLVSLCKEPRYQIAIRTAFGFPNAAAAANNAADIFLHNHPEAEWLCLIDNDTTPPDNLMRMLDDARDANILGTVTHQYQNGKLSVQQGWGVGLPGRGFTPLELGMVRGQTAVDRLGGGAWFIRRRAFNDMERPYFVELFESENHNLWVSDDVYFQNVARSKGIQLICDTRFISSHFHSLDLSGQLSN